MSVDYFLKVDGIDGESQDSQHTNEIDILSFRWNESQTGSMSVQGGGGSGKVKMGDFTFVMRMNKAAPKLMLSCAKGDHIKSAVLTCRKAGGGQQEFCKFTLSDLIVSSFVTGSGLSNNGEDTAVTAGDNDQDLNCVVAFNFSKIECEYRPQKSDGSLDNPVKVGYDVKANKAV